LNWGIRLVSIGSDSHSEDLALAEAFGVW